MIELWMSHAGIDLPGGPTQIDVAVMIVVALMAGLARGFSGFGAALIFMPIGSALVGPQAAAAILWIIDTSMSLPMLPAAVRLADTRQVGLMTIGAMVGVPLGTAVLAYADPLLVRWAIVIIVAGLLGLLIFGWRYSGKPRPPLTIGVGALAGLFGGAAQVGGPPVIAYWLGTGLPANLVRANIIAYFGCATILSGISYWLAGLLSLKALALALVAAPAYAIGLRAGSTGFRFARESLFRRICFGLIGVAVLLGMPLLDPLLR